MGDVGDGHHQAPAPAHLLAEDRIVEVPGGLTVDGHQGQLAQVFAALEVALLDLVRHCLVFGLGFLGKLKGQVVLAQGDLDFHTRVSIVAEDLDDAADGLGIAGRLFQDFHHHHIAGPGLELGPLVGHGGGGNQDVLADALVLRHHELDAVLFHEPAHQAGVGPLQHFDDGGLAAAAAVQADAAHQHPVAVQHLVHLLGLEEQVVAAVVRLDEAEAVRMAFHLARNQVRLLRQDVGVLAVAQQLAVPLHGVETALEEVLLIPADVQQGHQLVEGNGASLVLQQLHGVFPGRQGNLVLLALPFKEGIVFSGFG